MNLPPDAAIDTPESGITTLAPGLTVLQCGRERRLFLQAFFSDIFFRWSFSGVGAIWPTCEAVRSQIFKHFPEGTKRALNVGAGTGVFERDILLGKHAHRFSHLQQWDALEPHEPFARFFKETVKDSRFRLHAEFSSELPTIVPPESIDIALTTVPMLPKDAQVEFYREILTTIIPGGRLIHAIFKDVHESMATAGDVSAHNVRVIPAKGQWLPPCDYLVQILDKPSNTIVYRLPDRPLAHPTSHA